MKEIKTLKQKLGCYFSAGNDLDVGPMSILWTKKVEILC